MSIWTAVGFEYRSVSKDSSWLRVQKCQYGQQLASSTKVSVWTAVGFEYKSVSMDSSWLRVQKCQYGQQLASSTKVSVWTAVGFEYKSVSMDSSWLRVQKCQYGQQLTSSTKVSVWTAVGFEYKSVSMDSSWLRVQKCQYEQQLASSTKAASFLGLHIWDNCSQPLSSAHSHSTAILFRLLFGPHFAYTTHLFDSIIHILAITTPSELAEANELSATYHESAVVAVFATTFRELADLRCDLVETA